MTTPLSGFREAQLLEAVNLLLDARRTGQPLGALPPTLLPTSNDEAIFIQDKLAESFGAIGGWKIGAASADATPTCAPMPRAWIAPNAASLAGVTHWYRGLEAEVAFLLGADLPPRATPYTDDEVYAAVQSCHPAIEVLESAFADPASTPELAKFADLQRNGGFVFGPAFEAWRTIDFLQEHVTLAVDGTIRVEATGSNTAGNLLRLLPWLANEGATRTGGLYAGQWITTGSWTGNTPGMASASVDVHFSTLGRVSLHFA